MRLLVISVLVLKSVFGAYLTGNFKTCYKSDPNLTECLRSSIENSVRSLADGNSELGLFPVEPLHIDLISVGRVSSSTISLDQKFSNIRLHGITQSKVKKVSLDLDNYTLHMEAFTPVLRSEADFEIKGQLLIFPVNGKGPSNVTMVNLKTLHHITGERYRKRGKDHIRVTDYKISLLPQKIDYKFHNVLDAGERSVRINEEIHRVINENSVAVFDEVRPATEESYGLIFKHVANRIFKKVPLTEIYRE